MTENEIAKLVVDAIYQVHVTLGPGLFESVYEEALCWEDEQRGLAYTRQEPIPVV